MTTTKIKNLELKVEKKQAEIAQLGPMRPGSMTTQYRDSKEKTGEFYQLSYTHLSKSRSELIRPEHVKIIRVELKTYQKYKKLSGELLDLCIELSKAKLTLLKETASK